MERQSCGAPMFSQKPSTLRNLGSGRCRSKHDRGRPRAREYDRYIGDDHAVGGGMDIKYFFHRYFGIGVEGFVVDARKGGFDIFEDPRMQVFDRERLSHQRAVGSVLGTFTLRYPVPCTRFAPYVWAGVGAIFGGGESDELYAHSLVDPPDAFNADASTVHQGTRTELLGQFGGGFEIRITRTLAGSTISVATWSTVRETISGCSAAGINFAF